jgi:hypothetical protein
MFYIIYSGSHITFNYCYLLRVRFDTAISQIKNMILNKIVKNVLSDRVFFKNCNLKT